MRISAVLFWRAVEYSVEIRGGADVEVSAWTLVWSSETLVMGLGVLSYIPLWFWGQAGLDPLCWWCEADPETLGVHWVWLWGVPTEPSGVSAGGCSSEISWSCCGCLGSSLARPGLPREVQCGRILGQCWGTIFPWWSCQLQTADTDLLTCRLEPKKWTWECWPGFLSETSVGWLADKSWGLTSCSVWDQLREEIVWMCMHFLSKKGFN